jgi:hypothetical protein
VRLSPPGFLVLMQGALMHRNPAKNPKPKYKSKILKLAQIMN